MAVEMGVTNVESPELLRVLTHRNSVQHTFVREHLCSSVEAHSVFTAVHVDCLHLQRKKICELFCTRSRTECACTKVGKYVLLQQQDSVSTNMLTEEDFLVASAACVIFS
jgi:hypothetical protein